MNLKSVKKISQSFQEIPSSTLPLFSSKISAGFPSPADDMIEDTIDLNEYLISNRAATYLVQVTGDSMIGAAICEGDILVVDASLKPGDGKIVVASVEGEFTVKRYCVEKDKVLLKAENENYQNIEINPEDELRILGVVVGVVRKVK